MSRSEISLLYYFTTKKKVRDGKWNDFEFYIDVVDLFALILANATLYVW